jgi:hypothetical protein
MMNKLGQRDAPNPSGGLGSGLFRGPWFIGLWCMQAG